jgi:hypothetical protein
MNAASRAVPIVARGDFLAVVKPVTALPVLSCRHQETGPEKVGNDAPTVSTNTPSTGALACAEHG